MPSLQEALSGSGVAPAAPGPEDDEAIAEAFSDAKDAFESGDARAFGRALNLLRTLTDDD